MTLRLTAWIVVLHATLVHAQEPFRFHTVETPDRIVQADLADLDGDNHGDLVWTGIRGLPPTETRELHIHFGTTPVTFSQKAELRVELPDGIAAYDLADIDGEAGIELLLLARDHIRVWSFRDRKLSERRMTLPSSGSLAAATDERGMDRLRLMRDELHATGRILVPGFGHTIILDRAGTSYGSVPVGARANYFVPPRPGPIIGESEIEIFFDHPRLEVGDINGDGYADLLAANRHVLRPFLQQADGRFTAGRPIALGMISPEDSMRSAGSVRVTSADLDGDAKTDLVIMNNRGSLFRGNTTITVHRNRGGSWNLTQPDQTFEMQEGATTHQLLDIDGDGRTELVTVRIRTGVLEVVETLLTRAIDAEISIFQGRGASLFATDPAHRWKIGVGVNFETLRLKGFVPTLSRDFNGDGHVDFLRSRNGEGIDVNLGSPALGFETTHGSQTIPTSGRIRFGDLDRDGLTDLVLYDPRNAGSPLRVGHNLGAASLNAP